MTMTQINTGAARNPHHRGFAGMPAVTLLALILTLSLLFLFRSNSINHDQAVRAQLRGDYHQREEALLRAVVAVLPPRAIACMKADYADASAYSWSTIFAESVAMSAADESLPTSVLTTLGLSGARRVDVGDASVGAVTSWITSLGGVAGQVTPGTTDYASVFSDPKFAGKVPPLLNATSGLQVADAVCPIVSLDKHYSTQQTGLLANVANYPIYNRMAYPNIRFGFGAAGQPFVAKRNWWAFSVTYGSTVPGVPIITKYYVLSLYEMPTQLPIEGAATAEIGTYEDGTTWDAAAVTIDGGVYGNQVSMNGGFGTERISAKESIAMAAPIDLDGSGAVGDDFDEPHVREGLQVDRNSDLLPVAVSANSGRLTFVPIQRGADFLQAATTPNAWESYTRGAEKCSVTVAAIAMAGLDDQSPTSIRVQFRDSAGDPVPPSELTRGSNWPALHEPDGDTIPFQTELTSTNRSALTFYPALLAAWLTANGGASVAINNGISIRADSTAEPLTVLPISDPPTDEDMSVIIRKGRDLTAFSNGLSIVTPHRVYVGDDLNDIAVTAPPEGWLSPDTPPAEYYPPLSIFSAEMRIGTTGFVRPFEHHGQVTTLSTDGGAWHPLDLKSGSDDAVHGADIAAELTALTSPAELPPVHQMNWLVTVEEIPQD